MGLIIRFENNIRVIKLMEVCCLLEDLSGPDIYEKSENFIYIMTAQSKNNSTYFYHTAAVFPCQMTMAL